LNVAEERQRIGKLLLRQARKWADPRFLPFVSRTRRAVKVRLLRAKARENLKSAETIRKNHANRGTKPFASAQPSDKPGVNRAKTGVRNPAVSAHFRVARSW
jgi:hypothetical protein